MRIGVSAGSEAFNPGAEGERSAEREKEVRLRRYDRLQEPRGRAEGVLKRILHGLSCWQYWECPEARCRRLLD